jgi:uncharacterized protein (TIGR02588 family)
MSAKKSETSENNEEGEQSEQNSDEQPTSIWEWLTLVVSGLIVAAVVGSLLWFGSKNGSPNPAETVPTITVRLETDKARSQENVHYIPLRVENKGRIAVEAVKVRVTLNDANGKPDEREVEFDILPEGASEAALIVSPVPPEKAQPKAEVLNFKVREKARGF